MKSHFAPLAIVAPAIAGMLVLAGCGETKTVASVNGQNITKGELDARLEAQNGRQTLQQMVQQDLVFQYAKQHSISVSDADINKQLSQIESRFPPGQFETILKQQGLTLDDAKNVVREQLIVKNAVDQSITVPEAEIKDYFTKNHASFDTPKQVRARHILVKTKGEADSIEAQLARGANFADLAKKNSMDPGTKDKGGELGFFGPNQMVKAFQDTAFGMRVGQTSQPVQTPFGWHIIQVEEIRPAQTATLANAHDKVRDQLQSAQEQQLIPQFMQNLRGSAKITSDVYPDLFPTAAPSVPGAPTPTPKK